MITSAMVITQAFAENMAEELTAFLKSRGLKIIVTYNRAEFTEMPRMSWDEFALLDIRFHIKPDYNLEVSDSSQPQERDVTAIPKRLAACTDEVGIK